MKRQALLKHLLQCGCVLLREGRSHSIWVNPANGHQTSIPRHRDVNDFTSKAICKQLGIPNP